MRINVGCGEKRIPGWIGVDVTSRSAADIVAPLDRIPLPDECADEVMAVHVLEHVWAWEAPAALREWHRLLKKGGKLTIELPDLMKACRNMLEGKPGRSHPDQLGMWALFGDPTHKDPLMCHRWAYTFATLKPLVQEAGFVMVTEHDTQFHSIGKGVRDFRLEAYK